MRCARRVLESVEAFEPLKDDLGNILIEVSIDGINSNCFFISGIYDIVTLIFCLCLGILNIVMENRYLRHSSKFTYLIMPRYWRLYLGCII